MFACLRSAQSVWRHVSTFTARRSMPQALSPIAACTSSNTATRSISTFDAARVRVLSGAAGLRGHSTAVASQSKMDAPKQDSSSKYEPQGPTPKTSMMFTIHNAPGSLQKVLSFFWKHDINMTRLESKPVTRGTDYKFFVVFEGFSSDPQAQRLIKDLQESAACTSVQIVDAKTVPWFPTRIQDVDEFANEILDAGSDLQSDHPGFHDVVYRKRREELAEVARNHRYGKPIPFIKYTDDEVRTWGTVYNKLRPLLSKHACKEHVALLPLLEKHCGYSDKNIPQVRDISEFMKARTGFVLRPIAGLLSARNFLYGLAFRCFFSTQYIRHHSKPLYTPEPDICHELLGHAPLFADPAFADFSQEIGLASIGATDDQITQLARCYWFSVEFGLCEENGERKAYGAGLLSSFGELEYAMSSKPEIRKWNPFDAAKQDYPITTYQPIYYMASSFEDAKQQMRSFAESLARPFHVRYNDQYNTVEVDSNVKLLPHSPPKTKQAPLVPPHSHGDA